MSVGKALIAAKEQATDPYQALEAVVPWERFVASVEEAGTLARPRDPDYLDLLYDSYSQIRKYSPALLETFTFHALSSLQPLVEALDLIRGLGRKQVPDDAPTAFVKPHFIASVPHHQTSRRAGYASQKRPTWGVKSHFHLREPQMQYEGRTVNARRCSSSKRGDASFTRSRRTTRPIVSARSFCQMQRELPQSPHGA
ncbi:hypothetical protein [Ktedonobacter robiniae]|uniref:Transposase n=1 Tax=Ktedonobacter robiniae TaxID=2778365 RepID=A0ABQ3UXD1_9CHLR|nr:hypothetical protein [Ktedonobacter robiniae]GHO57529.1 hypothetical protein KSB_60040 [Ktedonobacter robiniae]